LTFYRVLIFLNYSLVFFKEDLAKEKEIKQYTMVEDLQKERKKLNLLLIKQKNFSKIKLFKISSDFNKKITEITENSNKIKKKEVNNTLVYEQRQLLIHQQKVSLKKQLAKLDAEYNKLKLSLEKEVIYN
jgi:hypothetical protein